MQCFHPQGYRSDLCKLLKFPASKAAREYPLAQVLLKLLKSTALRGLKICSRFSMGVCCMGLESSSSCLHSTPMEMRFLSHMAQLRYFAPKEIRRQLHRHFFHGNKSLPITDLRHWQGRSQFPWQVSTNRPVANVWPEPAVR